MLCEIKIKNLIILEKIIQKWYKRVDMIKNIRFIASNRYHTLNHLSNLSITFLSIYVVILSLLSFSQTFKHINANDLNIINVSLSIFIMALSLLDSANQFKLKAIRFHDCGKELGVLYNELSFMVDIEKVDVSERTSEKASAQAPERVSEEKIRELVARYDAIIAKYEENHKEIDFQIYRTMKAKVYDISALKVAWIEFKVYLQTRFIYHFLIFAPPLIIIYQISL